MLWRANRLKLYLTLSSTPAGTMIGRNEREWGQIGVRMIHGTLGCTIDAPAAAEYAVLPVAVATIKPEKNRKVEVFTDI